MTPVSPPKYRLHVDKDVDVQTRDGMRLKADVYRPRGRGRFPAIINLGSYQKDKHWVPPLDLGEKDNPYMNWETVNPLWWVPRGYAAVRVDGRGSGKSPGRTDPFSLQEALDFHDAIEWAARQPWCNGNVGLLGISYFAMTQWFVANLKPRSLKAIIPWPKRSCRQNRKIRNCASTPAPITTRSTPRKRATIKYASSTIGSRAGKTA